MFEFDQYSFVKPVLEKLVEKDRQKYADCYELVIDYCISENLICGGEIGIKLLLGEERTIDDYELHIYGKNILRHSNYLTNKIYNQRPGDIVALEHGNTLTVDRRTIAIFYEIGELQNAIAPLKALWFSRDKHVFVMPPELQMIDLYRKYYSPQYAGEWEHIGERLEKLLNWGIKRIAREMFDVKGGFSKKEVHVKVIGVPDTILVGEHAINLLEGRPHYGSGIVQLIAKSNVLATIVELLQPYGKVSHTRKYVRLYSDKRLYRTSIRIDEVEVVYIFNSCDYDLVPFLDYDGVKVGHPRVLFRYLLLDIWFLKLAGARGSIDEDYFMTRVRAIYRKIEKLMEIDKIAFPESTHKFMGDFVDERIAEKMANLEKKKRYIPTYYPEMYMKIHETLRII